MQLLKSDCRDASGVYPRQVEESLSPELPADLTGDNRRLYGTSINPSTDTSEAGPCSLKMRYKNVCPNGCPQTDCPNDCPQTVQLPPSGYIFSIFQRPIHDSGLQRKRTTSENGQEMRENPDILLPGKTAGK